MESVTEIWEFIKVQLLPHCPFLSWMVISMLIGQVLNKSVFTKKNMDSDKKPDWLYRWGRKTLVLQPVFAGLLVGLAWQNPEAAVVGIPASMAYFAVAGGLSTWVYELLKGLAKKKGVNLALPGLENGDDPEERKTPVDGPADKE